MSARAVVAAGVSIGPFVFIGPDVEVGAGTTIHPNVVITGDVRIGQRVVVGPGTVIGVDGFGYRTRNGRHERLPHSGRIVIEDDVELGANVTVARARDGRETRIGRGTKVDCLVHIGHNVTIGRDCLIVAQTGIAGSAVIGDGVTLAGQVGVSDHVRIGAGAVVYARSAVFRSIPPGAHYSGMPARPHGQMRRFWARLWRQYGGER